MANSGPPEVAVLIVNWNDKHSMLETLESVYGLMSLHIEVFLVDNGSTGKGARLEHQKPGEALGHRSS
jgi:GT2 family glycosyltransferase